MKRLWARIGMSVDITDEEYAEIKALLNENKRQEVNKILSQMFLNRAYRNGESYMPGNYCGACDDNPNECDFELTEV